MSWKRLAVYLGCAALIYCVVMGAAIIKRTRQNDQLRNNLRLVEAHLALAGPQWKAFRQTNAGLEFVQLRATYHQEGSLEVCGPVTSQVQVAQVLQFVRDIHPPRPLWTNALRVDAAFYQYYLSELDGPASRSQPIRSEPSQTSPAAGSRR
jgi:hypothetical protein